MSLSQMRQNDLIIPGHHYTLVEGVLLDQTPQIGGWRPLGNRILAEPLGSLEQFCNDSPIILAEKYKADDVVFRVLSIGPGRKLKNGTVLPIPLECGWRVVCRAWDAPHVEIDGRKLRLLNVDTIELVLPP